MSTDEERRVDISLHRKSRGWLRTLLWLAGLLTLAVVAFFLVMGVFTLIILAMLGWTPLGG